MSDHRQLFVSGRGADTILQVGEHTFHVHGAILRERSPGFAVLFSESDTPNQVTIDSNISRSHMHEILMFLYAGSNSTWDTHDWNALMFASLDLNLSDVTESLIEWRSHESAGDQGELRGDMRNKIVAGWKASAYGSAEDEPDTSDCLTFSFEFEGNSLQIFSYYRPEYIDEDSWLGMSIEQQQREIAGNWARLKRRIDRNAMVWMNRNLTIEDAGFLWEVSYGGDTPGYAVDLDHVFDEIRRVVDSGLSVGDREMDSGMQMHVAFPFMQPEDRPYRRAIMALMVHVDDWLFLRDFSRAIIDDCNNMWSSDDVAQLFAAIAGDEQQLAEHVTHGQMPNPAVKHKHIGLRGKDTYKVAHRYGMEFRRAGSVEQQEDLVRYVASILSQIGRTNDTNQAADNDAAGAHVMLRLRSGASRSPHRPQYPLGQVIEFVSNATARVLPTEVHPSSELDLDKLDSVAEHWVHQLECWEHHLVNCKLLLWDSMPSGAVHQIDKEVRERAWLKIRRRLAFVLLSDWTHFPYSLWVSGDRIAVLRSLVQEQRHIREVLLQKLLGSAARQQLQHDLADIVDAEAADAHAIRSKLRADDARIVELRSLIVDFAVRLSNLY
jgi:hypothetical protein